MHFMPRKAEPGAWYSQAAGGAGVRVVCTLFAGSRRRGWLGCTLYGGAPGYRKRCTHKVCTLKDEGEKVCSSYFMHLAFSPSQNSRCKRPHLVICQPGIAGNGRERQPALLQ